MALVGTRPTTTSRLKSRLEPHPTLLPAHLVVVVAVQSEWGDIHVTAVYTNVDEEGDDWLELQSSDEEMDG